MILIISTCQDSLSELEFVKPLQHIVKDAVVVHFTKITQKNLASADKIILTGTALADFDYLHHDFNWLRTINKPVLGICAGMQAIVKAFDLPLQDHTSIGVKRVEVIQENKLVTESFDAYFLHAKTTGQGFNILATSNQTPCMIKHPTKEIYACIFHPEVINPDIIKNFVDR